MVTRLFIVFSFIFVWRIAAQQNKTKFERVSLDDGIPYNFISDIHQDSKGFLWFGTMHGLVRYDGYDYRIYRHDPLDAESISHDDILNIFEDRGHNLWIGTYGGGLNKFDPRTRKFTRYLHSERDSASLSSNTVWSIQEDQEGSIWVGTEGGGLNILSGALGFVHYMRNPAAPKNSAPNYIRCICRDRSGRMWIGSLGRGLCRFDKEKGLFKYYRHDPSNSNSLSDNDVLSIFEDASGSLWIGTANGLNRLDTQTEKFTVYRTEAACGTSISSNQISRIYEDREGILWIGTLTGGLNKFDSKSGTFVQYRSNPSDPTSLLTDAVVAISEDGSGILWIGTAYGGLHKLSKFSGKFTAYSHDPASANSISNNYVLSMCEDAFGSLWIGTNSGLDKLDRRKDKITHYPAVFRDRSGQTVNTVSDIASDPRGDLWIATLSNGLMKFTQDGFARPLTDFPELRTSALSRVYPDRNGNLWIGSFTDGLICFNEKNKTVRIFRHDAKDSTSLPDNSVLSLYEDRLGQLWVGTYGGLSRLSENGTFKNYRHDPFNTRSLSHNYVYAIHEAADSTLWIGTGNGLDIHKQFSDDFVAFREKDGLANDVICGILEDGHGSLWMSTQKGISTLDRKTMQFRNYDRSDGLQSNMFVRGAYFKSERGEMFFGGVNGFNSFFPDSIRDNPYVPPVRLTLFKKFDKVQELDTDISDIGEIELSYSDNFFTLGFAALDFTASSKNRYAYKLEGFDADWIYSGTRHEAGYTNLDPGEYTFRVKASNSDGIWNEGGTTIRVLIKPPFWRTWWFYLCLITGVTAAFVTVYRIVLRRKVRASMELERIKLKERDHVRQQISRDFHDELGHRLTKINLYSELIRRKMTGKNTEVKDYFQKVTESAHRLSVDTRDFIWALDPSHDSLYDIVVNLRDFGFDLFDSTDIQFRVSGMSDELTSVKLSEEWRRQLTLIFKEALHNILKHSGCGTVVLDTAYKKDLVQMSLRDDGAGFDPEKIYSGNGLRNIRERALKLHSRIDITSTNTLGTEIRFRGTPVQDPRNGNGS